MDAARALAQARKLARLSQRELADRSGVTQSTVARIESGAMGVRVVTLDKLLRECGFALEMHKRLGVGVDRTMFSFNSPPQDRISTMAASSRNVAELVAEMRKTPPAGPFDPVRMLITLCRHAVRFVLIGGVADNAYGGSSITDDLDVCYAADPENIERLTSALGELGAHERIDLRVSETSRFATEVGNLDCVRLPLGTHGYDDLVRSAWSTRVQGAEVLIASIDDLVRMKRAVGRPVDLAELEILGALREELEQRGEL